MFSIEKAAVFNRNPHTQAISTTIRSPKSDLFGLALCFLRDCLALQCIDLEAFEDEVTSYFEEFLLKTQR